MRHYQIHYSSKNNYEKEVWGAYLKFLVYPFSSKGVQINKVLVDFNVDGDWWISNSRNQEINEIYFKTKTKFSEIEINFSANVTVPKLNPFDKQWLNSEIENQILNSTDWQIDNYKNIFTSLNRPKSYLNKSDCALYNWIENGNLLDKIMHLSNQVYTNLEFTTGVTDTTTCAFEIIHSQKGVCQDFVHLLLGLLRNFGVPCRYVSGYLHEEEGIRGASQLHAWVECNIPNVGWIGIDPTNNLLIDHNYIKICHGYDFDDCLSVSGVVNTLAKNQTTIYQVNVQQIQ